MNRRSTEKLPLGEDDRVHGQDIQPGQLLKLRSSKSSGEPVHLPMFVVEKEGAGGLLTIVTGRLVTRELQAVELDLQFRDGYFKNAVLAKAVEDIKGEGQGYALPLFAQHTQLPAEFLGVLAFSDIEAPF